MINLRNKQIIGKRIFDLIFATVGLIGLTPLFLVVGILIKITSSGPILFKQKRMGLGLESFSMYKFRTMINNATTSGPSITVNGDSRITSVGKLLRALKIDELPQLINVLKGEMSIVGPRPEVSYFVNYYKNDFKIIMGTKPGITDLASIFFFNEQFILAKSNKPEEFYLKSILPRKIKLAKIYIQRQNLSLDIKIIFKTFMAILPFYFPIFFNKIRRRSF